MNLSNCLRVSIDFNCSAKTNQREPDGKQRVSREGRKVWGAVWYGKARIEESSRHYGIHLPSRCGC